MKKIMILACLSLLFMNQGIAQLMLPPDYTELPDPKPMDVNSWKNVPKGAHSGFVSVNEHFSRSSAPGKDQIKNTWHTKSWRGERIHTQALIYSTTPLKGIRLETSELKTTSGDKISKESVHASFVRYVMTDHLGDLKSGCGINHKLDSSLAADMIDNIKMFSMEANTSRPVWLSIDVPVGAAPGIYSGTLNIAGGKFKASHPFTIEVLEHVLPPAKDWKFHLDLWQNPYSDARINGVELWSDKHFEVMKPVYSMLANAGQKVITATLIQDPWSSQTYDVYGGMIKWIKRKDNSWKYDYTIFDKWIKFMIDLGIDKEISCYSMIPWSLEFTYFDETSGKDEVLKTKPQSEEYKQHWGRMLEDFAGHLKEKGWFGITTIAMDERPEKDMQAAIAIIRAADPDFKISMAGNYHPEIQNQLYDYCIASGHEMSEETLAERKAKGFITTFYTACPEPYPNVFTSSQYAEATWLPWHALYRNFDGYLRWDYNNWNAHPLLDSRFGSWAAGDTYFVYPDARSSIRFERLREGIQDYTKASILKNEFTEIGETEKLKQLQIAIDQFTLKSLNGKNAHVAVDNAKEVLNSF